MPTEIKGVIELRKALRAYAPDLEKETRKEIYEIVKPVVANAKGYVPSEIMGLRKGWIRSTRTLKKITRGTSAFRKGVFPFFNPAEVKAKIVFSDKISKSNRSGFVSIFKLENKSRAGAIYEIHWSINSLYLLAVFSHSLELARLSASLTITSLVDATFFCSESRFEK